MAALAIAGVSQFGLGKSNNAEAVVMPVSAMSIDMLPFNPPEAGAQCAAADVVDDDGDGVINDGCPQVGALAESIFVGGCTNALDDDGDGFFNDGCPSVGNTSAYVGPRDSCARIRENGVMDLDEDSMDTKLMDVTAEGIPAYDVPSDDNGMLGFTYRFNYDNAAESNLTVTAATNSTTWKIAQAGGSLPSDASQALPDTPVGGAGYWVATVSDTGAIPGNLESGDGVLTRVAVESEAAAVAGLYPLTLTFNAVLDNNNVALATTTVNNATLAVSTVATFVDCPTPTDMKINFVNKTPPTTAEVSDQVFFDVFKSFHNNTAGPAAPATVTQKCLGPVDGECSFHVTNALKAQVLPGSLTVSIDANGDTTPDGPPVVDPPDSTMFASRGIEVKYDLMLMPSVPGLVNEIQNWDIHCLEPSTHSWSFTTTIANQNPATPDPDEDNNTDVNLFDVDCTVSDADVQIVSQSFSSVPPAKCPLATSPGCTAAIPYPPILPGAANALNLDIDKELHNQGGSQWTTGALNVDITKIAFVDYTAGGLFPLGGKNAAHNPCSVSAFGGDNPNDVSLPFSVQTNHNETFTLTCSLDPAQDPAGNGMGRDDDGDGLVDEDRIDGLDNDGDTLFDEDAGFLLPTLCISNAVNIDQLHVEEAPGTQEVNQLVFQQSGGMVIQFEDAYELTCQTFIFERALHTTFSVTQDEDDVPSDPVTGGADGLVGAPYAGDDVGTPPTDDDCLLTTPCEQLIKYSFGDTTGVLVGPPPGPPTNPGDEPLTGVITIVPGAKVLVPAALTDYNYYITRGDADPFNGTVPNGTRTAAATARATVGFPGGPCATPLPFSLNLVDGALPAAVGEGPDSPSIGDIPNPGVFPTRITSDPLYASLLGAGLSPWARFVGEVPGLGTDINVIVFNGGLPGGGFLHILIIGDPSVPTDPLAVRQCTPTIVATDYLGETGAEPEHYSGECFNNIDNDDDATADDGCPGGPAAVGAAELNPAANQCGNALDEDGDGAFNDGCPNVGAAEVACGPAVNDDVDPGYAGGVINDGCPAVALGVPVDGRDLRTCQTIKGGTTIPPNVTDWHVIAGRFTRADTGQQVTLVDLNKCTADNDVSVDKSDNQSPDVPADVPTQLPITVNITNGAVPGNVFVSLSLIGPAVCNPHLIPDLDGVDSDLSAKTPDVLTNGPNVGGNQATRLDWTALAMGAFEPRSVTRNYEVTCPQGGPYGPFQVVANVSSNLPDNDTDNNQDENWIYITANDNDLDDDGVLNADDNCPADDNPGQEDADGDGIGDVCDPNDDNDALDDASDDCDTVAEDMDGQDDTDGCPETDSAIKYVIKNPAYDVDVSVSHTENIKVGIENQGNIVADLEATLLLKSQVGVCEAHWIPQAGDGVIEDNIGGTLHSVLTRVLPNMLPGETREISRNYTVHCFSKSLHDNAVKFEVGVVPVWPVEEDSDDVLDNVHKQNIDITAYAQADVKKLGLIIPDPAMVVSTDLVLTTSHVLHNNGPFGPVTVVDEFEGDAPPDCTINGQSGDDIDLGSQNIDLPVSVTVSVDVDVTLHCTAPSNHTFEFRNRITDIVDLHVEDPNTDNNAASLSLTNPVTTQADVAVTGVTVTSPASEYPDTDFNVTVEGDVSNLGPSSPVNAQVVLSLNVPGDCTKTPAGSQNAGGGAPLAIPMGPPTHVSAVWTVKCSTTSNHQFNGTVTATPEAVLHVSDPNPNNNSGSNSDITVIAVDLQFFPIGFVDPNGNVINRVDVKIGDFSTVIRAKFKNHVNDPKNVGKLYTVTEDATLTGIPGGNYHVLCGNDAWTKIPAAQKLSQTCTVDGVTRGYSYNFTVPPATTLDMHATWRLAASTYYTQQIDWLHIREPADDPESAFEILTDSMEPGLHSLEMCVTKSIVEHETNLANNSGCMQLDLGIEACDGLDNDADTLVDEGYPDTDGDDIADCVDDTPDHDVGVKYCLKFGPAPINLTDTGGSYVWVLCEVGNFSGHTEHVQITAAADLITSALPAGCTKTPVLLIPGRTDFVLLGDPGVNDDGDGEVDEDPIDGYDNDGDTEIDEDPPDGGEQKFVLYRAKLECHDPAQQSVIPFSVTVSIDHLAHVPGPDGDDTNPANDSVTLTQNINIGPPPPP
jgi:hypothetical protein